MKQVSIIIPTLNEGQNVIDTVRCVLDNSAYDQLEVVVSDDGSTDGSIEAIGAEFAQEPVSIVSNRKLGIAGNRNAGANQASGDILVFLDGHCYVSPGWLQPIVDAFVAEHVGMVGPTFSDIRRPGIRACGVTWSGSSLKNTWLAQPRQASYVPFHIGACQAIRADAFHALGGYDEGMTRYGSEDIEICLRLWLYGYTVVAQPESLVFHLFRDKHPYHVDFYEAMYNYLRMIIFHFDEQHMRQILHHLLKTPQIERSLARAMADDAVWQSRQHHFAQRKHDFDWFCRAFNIQF